MKGAKCRSYVCETEGGLVRRRGNVKEELAKKTFHYYYFSFFFLFLLFSLQHDQQAHDTQHDRLQPGVLAQHDGDVADEGHVADDAADDVAALEVVLAAGVELRVVGGVVVALGEQLRVLAVAELAHHAVHDGDVFSPHVVDHDLAHVRLRHQVPVPEK